MNEQAIDASCDTTEPLERAIAKEVTLKVLLLIPAVAVVIVLLFLSLGHARISQTGAKFIGALVYSLLIGVPSTILLTWIGFRWPARLARFVLLPQALSLAMTATLGCLAAAMVCQWIGLVRPGSYWREVRSSYPFSVVVTFIVGLSVSAYQALRYRLQSATIALQTKRAEQERANKLIAEARLSSLESRLHPHFLFNTLNSIAALIPRDPQRAEDTVSKLASLLRFSLASSSGLVPLAQELKFVRDYLDIESTRFGPRLRYEIDVPSALLEVKTPPMALQSLVENAVKHVASQRPEGAHVRITGQLENGLARLEVTDDGPGFSLDAITPEHGLGNLMARLQLLFADRGKLLVTRRDDRTVVGLEFPAEG